MTHLLDHTKTIIGVDLGGTKVRSCRIAEGCVIKDDIAPVPSKEKEAVVIEALIKSIQRVWSADCAAIGIGVPSVVDVEKGIVYDVQNIPSWKEVHLKDILESEFGVPVHMNNDANCFALGVHVFGKGRGSTNMLGLIIGTGLAAGIIINNQIYNGYNCGSGEFGMIPYKDQYVEYYASGQFFPNCHNTSGQEEAVKARKGDRLAQNKYQEYGTHLGHAINIILYALDPELIVLGGSVSKSYDLFEKSLWTQIRKIAYHKMAERLTIKVEENPDVAVLGAAALCLSHHQNNTKENFVSTHSIDHKIKNG